MARENFNRHENDAKFKKSKKEKRIRSPISKGSLKTKEKRHLREALDKYDYGDYDED